MTASKHPTSKCGQTVARTILPVIGDLRSDLMTNSREILFEEICVRPTTGVFVAEQDLGHSIDKPEFFLGVASLSPKTLLIDL